MHSSGPRTNSDRVSRDDHLRVQPAPLTSYDRRSGVSTEMSILRSSPSISAQSSRAIGMPAVKRVLRAR